MIRANKGKEFCCYFPFTVVIFGRDLARPDSIESKSVSEPLSGTNYFPLTNLSDWWHVASLSLIYRHIHGKWSDGLHSLVTPVLTYTVRNPHVTYIVANHSHYLYIPSIRISSAGTAYSREPLLFGTDFQEGVSTTTKILACLSLAVIFPCYL